MKIRPILFLSPPVGPAESDRIKVLNDAQAQIDAGALVLGDEIEITSPAGQRLGLVRICKA